MLALAFYVVLYIGSLLWRGFRSLRRSKAPTEVAPKQTIPLGQQIEEYLLSLGKNIFQIFKGYQTEDQKNAWGVIGGICGTSWDVDFPMTKIDDTTWESEVLELNAGEEFKVRQGASWDVNFGVEFNGANIVVEADGKYQVKLVLGDTVSVELIPVN